jgi:hypothetical protein
VPWLALGEDYGFENLRAFVCRPQDGDILALVATAARRGCKPICIANVDEHFVEVIVTSSNFGTAL